MHVYLWTAPIRAQSNMDATARGQTGMHVDSNNITFLYYFTPEYIGDPTKHLKQLSVNKCQNKGERVHT